MIRRAAAHAVVVAALAACAMISAPAFAQSRLSIEVRAAAALPVGAALRTDAVLSDEIAGEPSPGLPRIVDRFSAPGVSAGARVVVGLVEAGYSLTRLPWGRSLRICTSDSLALRLPNGRIDDADAQWTCVRRSRAPQVDLLDAPAALLVHALDGGVRLYAAPRRLGARGADGPSPAAGVERGNGALRAFAVVGGGIRLANAPVSSAARRIRPGLGLVAGAGVELRVGSGIWLVADARWHLDVLMTGGRTTDESRRAVAAGRGPASVVLDSLHRATVGVSARVDLR
jgi:hypothetical protein